MSETLLTVDADHTGLASGSTGAGRTVGAWSGAGYAPAGVGPRSTATDMARLMTAMLSSTAPGFTAATPQFTDDDGSRIGYGWFTDSYGDREITWHNGDTGGFSAYVGFDRTSTQGVVVLGNTDRQVEWMGLRLLGAQPPEGYAALGAVAGLLFTHRMGEWLTIPPPLWALSAGLAAAGATALALRWRHLPLMAAGPAWSRWTRTALSAALSVLVLIWFR